MFSTFLKELGGYFDRYWLLSVFFPSLAFWSACLLVYGLAEGLGQTLKAWEGQSGQVQFVLLFAGLGWVALSAYILGNFQTAIIRLFEGYWRAFPLSLLRKWRLRHQRLVYRYLKERTRLRRRLTRGLEDVLAFGTDVEKETALDRNRELGELERERLLFLPIGEDKVMPTRLGNIIRAAELYAWKRYGMDAVVLWPRLHALLPQDFIDNLLGAKTAMVFMLMLSLLAFAFAFVACAWLAAFTSGRLLFVVCALGVPFSWLCYRNALQSAALYGELIKSAFDLHRWKLLEVLHLKRPESYGEEILIWDDVTRLLYRSEAPSTAVYDTAKPAATAPPPGILVRLAEAVEKFFRGARADLLTQGAASSGDGTARQEQLVGAAPATSQARAEMPQAAVTAPPAAPARLPDARDEAAPPTRPLDYARYWCVGLYLLTFGSGAFWMWQRPAALVNLPVAARDLPAYHLVTQQDLKPDARPPDGLPDGVLTDSSRILYRYTLAPVPEGRALRGEQLQMPPSTDLLRDTTIVGIPATPSMLLGGSLKAGDVVDITIVPAGSQSAPPLENILVLDVKTVASQPAPQGESADPSCVILVALPSLLRDRFAAGQANSRLLISRHPQ